MASRWRIGKCRCEEEPSCLRWLVLVGGEVVADVPSHRLAVQALIQHQSRRAFLDGLTAARLLNTKKWRDG